MPTSRGQLLLAYPLAVAVGVLVGLCGSFFQQRGPVASVLAVLVTAVAIVLSGVATAARTGAVLAFLGWFLTVTALSLGRPEGDVVIAASSRGYVWIYGGALVGAAAMVPNYPRLASSTRRRRSMSGR